MNKAEMLIKRITNGVKDLCDHIDDQHPEDYICSTLRIDAQLEVEQALKKFRETLGQLDTMSIDEANRELAGVFGDDYPTTKK